MHPKQIAEKMKQLNDAGLKAQTDSERADVVKEKRALFGGLRGSKRDKHKAWKEASDIANGVE